MSEHETHIGSTSEKAKAKSTRNSRRLFKIHEKKKHKKVSKGTVQVDHVMKDRGKVKRDDNQTIIEDKPRDFVAATTRIYDQSIISTLCLDLVLNSSCNCDHKTYQGSLENLCQSFLPATHVQIKKLDELRSLSRKHENLLSVERIAPDNNCQQLLVTEPVNCLRSYFTSQLETLISKEGKVSKHSWWNHISVTYWKIFRGVSRGILFLHQEKLVCGDVFRNLFVTQDGTGRVLPSLDCSKKEDADVEDLIAIMWGVLTFPFQENLQPKDVPSSGFPLCEELISLFLVISEFFGDVPSSLLLDHPYFWDAGECIDYVEKLKKFIAKKLTTNGDNDVTINHKLKKELKSRGLFKDWSKQLSGKGVYKQVLSKGNPGKAWSPRQDVKLPQGSYTVGRYRNEIDIVRFYGAVYHHANDDEYRTYRPTEEKLTDETIEKELSSYFPEFYSNIFLCICAFVSEGNVKSDWLKLLSSCHYRDNDLTPRCSSLRNVTPPVRSSTVPSKLTRRVMPGQQRKPELCRLQAEVIQRKACPPCQCAAVDDAKLNLLIIFCGLFVYCSLWLMFNN